MFNEPATVICYGEVEEWKDRKKAITHFYRGAIECDGHEAERYLRIVNDLLDGEEYAWDGCEIPEGYEQILEARA